MTDDSPVVAVTLYGPDYRIVGTRSQPGYEMTPPSPATIAAITEGEQAGVADYQLDNEMLLSVAVVDETGPVRHIAAVISQDTLDETMEQASRAGFLATVVLATAAVLVALFVVRRVTRPIAQVTRAAIDLERGEFRSEELADAARRRDEMGLLARHFATMAQEVQARERRLAEQVSALKVRIDESERRRSVERITGTQTFADLADRARQMRERRAAATGRSHEQEEDER